MPKLQSFVLHLRPVRLGLALLLPLALGACASTFTGADFTSADFTATDAAASAAANVDANVDADGEDMESANSASQPTETSLPPTGLPNGVAAGDVDHDRAVLWARAGATGTITFTVSTYATEAESGAYATEAMQTFTATVRNPLQPVTVTVTGLMPGSAYAYDVTAPDGDAARGAFRTPALPDATHGLRFGVSGDWRGSLTPYVALTNATERDLDFFIALGDTVYADLTSPAVPVRQATTLDEFRRKHAEVYSSDLARNELAALRASTALYATIDDHEVLNDFAGGAQAARDARFPEENGRINETALYAHALQAFQEYNPLAQEYYDSAATAQAGDDGRMAAARKLYRYRTFGRDAAIFLLDHALLSRPARTPGRP